MAKHAKPSKENDLPHDREDSGSEFPPEDVLLEKSNQPVLDPAGFSDSDEVIETVVVDALGESDQGKQSSPVSSEGKAAKKAAKKAARQDMPAHHRKSRKMRIVLIITAIFLVCLFVALGVLTYNLAKISQDLAFQQAQDQLKQDAAALGNSDTKDAGSTTTIKTEIPQLVSLLGKTQEESVAAIGHGATVVSSSPAAATEGSVKTEIKISLTDEPGDTRSGTPTVYLGLNAESKVVKAGYSAPISSLGYGSLSFADAIKNERIVERTLSAAGIPVPEATVTLPSNKADYSKYATDGTTLVLENASFSGNIAVGGVTYQWSAVLRYDYTVANALGGKLTDTVRQIYIYVTA